ncbi:MAG: hypothetical protein KAU27_01385 [Desulfuromonadales bacterium]|nr:hypothetical protein [Desulfuromonadales bacterium]
MLAEESCVHTRSQDQNAVGLLLENPLCKFKETEIFVARVERNRCDNFTTDIYDATFETVLPRPVMLPRKPIFTGGGSLH